MVSGGVTRLGFEEALRRVEEFESEDLAREVEL